MNYYQFHIGDYRGATAHLSNDEDLCYRRILDLYYDKDGNLPDDGTISRRVRMPIEIVHSILKEFFTETDFGWHHERAQREIANFKKQAEGGKKGAEARWGGHRGAIATPSDTHMGLDAPPNATPLATSNHKPITSISPLPPKGGEEEEEVCGGSSEAEKTGAKAPVRVGDIAGDEKRDRDPIPAPQSPSALVTEERFSEFWEAYPESRRKNRFRSEAAWSEARFHLPDQKTLIHALEAFKASKEWRQDNGKFIPSPWIWISERRWQDAPAYSPVTKTKPKSQIDEADAFRWRAETYPESLEINPTAHTFPTRVWPESIRREYLASKKNQPQLQTA